MKTKGITKGNYVYDISSRCEVVTVDAIDLYGQLYREDDTQDDNLRLINPEPIPITEGWLKKFNFVDYANNGLSYSLRFNSHHELTFYTLEKWIRLQTQGGGWTIQYPHIKCVHELQNLYFALTGKELAPVE
jgi:hypothetical protein